MRESRSKQIIREDPALASAAEALGGPEAAVNDTIAL